MDKVDTEHCQIYSNEYRKCIKKAKIREDIKNCQKIEQIYKYCLLVRDTQPK